MKWEVSYVGDINEYFEDACLGEQDLIKIKVKMDHVAESPLYLSEYVQGLNNSNIRRVRFPDDFRMFILLDPDAEVIYCLAFMHRNHCYDKKSLNKVATIVRDFITSKPR